MAAVITGIKCLGMPWGIADYHIAVKLRALEVCELQRTAICIQKINMNKMVAITVIVAIRSNSSSR